MRYVDGYVLPVPMKNTAVYRGDDLDGKGRTPETAGFLRLDCRRGEAQSLRRIAL